MQTNKTTKGDRAHAPDGHETITFDLFRFSELSESAKERAKGDYAALFSYAWADEALASLRALAGHFGGKLADYAVDWFNSSYSSARFDMPDDLERAEINRRLSDLGSYDLGTLRGYGDCKLTGVCCDESAIDGFRWAFIRESETDLETLMQAAFDSWLKDCQADCEAFYSDDDFGDHCEANKYRFYEDGELA